MDTNCITNKYVNSHIKQSTVVNSNNTTTVNSKNYKDEINKILFDHNVTSEGVADLLSELLDDEKSKKYFIVLVEKYGSTDMLEIAYYVKDLASRITIRNRGKYFMGILRNKEYKTKFKKERQ